VAETWGNEAVKDKNEIDVEEPPWENAKPIGKLARLFRRGRGWRCHDDAFELNGHCYGLGGNIVMLAPENVKEKGYVTIIKRLSFFFRKNYLIILELFLLIQSPTPNWIINDNPNLISGPSTQHTYLWIRWSSLGW